MIDATGWTEADLHTMALDAHSPHCGCCGVPFPWCRTATVQEKADVAFAVERNWGALAITAAGMRTILAIRDDAPHAASEPCRNASDPK